MTNVQASTDKFAIGLSTMCMLHCLLTPVLITIMPVLAGLPIADEAFHLWLLAAVIPTSLFAITLGCKKHKHIEVVLVSILGIAFLVSAVVFGHDLFGENGEVVMTLIGSICLSISHVMNFRLCRKVECCDHE